MRVLLNHRKNGFFALTERSIEVDRARDESSSTVSIRFRVSGPVSLQLCLPHLRSAALPLGRRRSWLAVQHAARAELRMKAGPFG